MHHITMKLCSIILSSHFTSVHNDHILTYFHLTSEWTESMINLSQRKSWAKLQLNHRIAFLTRRRVQWKFGFLSSVSLGLDLFSQSLFLSLLFSYSAEFVIFCQFFISYVACPICHCTISRNCFKAYSFFFIGHILCSICCAFIQFWIVWQACIFFNLCNVFISNVLASFASYSFFYKNVAVPSLSIISLPFPQLDQTWRT